MIIRKTGGKIIIDGIEMHSPATIDSDKPGEFKILYPEVEEVEREDNNQRRNAGIK